MTTFYICRHGETENNQNNILSGWIDTPLTEKGIENAHTTASKLRGVTLDKIVSSDLGRAIATANIILKDCALALQLEQCMDLREVNYGNLANTPVNEYPRLSPTDNARFIPSGGESLTQMQLRVLACINKLAEQNPEQTILIVAHDGTINAVRAAFEHENIGMVDAASNNGHDFVARFTLNGSTIDTFTELQTAAA